LGSAEEFKTDISVFTIGATGGLETEECFYGKYQNKKDRLHFK
jgi:hypothetical protein